MDFEFSEAQILLRDSVRQLLTREHTFELQQAILESPHGHSDKLWRLLAELGVFGLGLPEDAGGYGGPTEIMLVMEELGRGLVLEPFMSTLVLGGGLVWGYGTVAQRARLLPKIATGNLRLALAHQEAGARYVLDPVATLARRAKGNYLLSGTKAGVLDAPLADLLIVSARDDAAGGLSLFMLEPAVAGVSWTTYRTQDGRSVADLVLDDVRLPTAARLGPPGVALTALEQAVDCGLAALCAEAVGAMEAVTDAVMQPELFLTATQAKAMSYLATGRCRDRDRFERRRALAAAKAFVGKAARHISQRTTPFQGDPGSGADLLISQYCKRLNMISATFGDTDQHIGAFSDLLRAESP
jgi:alkylation response protein AidB-like acyl-CoA dehydrogenase